MKERGKERGREGGEKREGGRRKEGERGRERYNNFIYLPLLSHAQSACGTYVCKVSVVYQLWSVFTYTPPLRLVPSPLFHQRHL